MEIRANLASQITIACNYALHRGELKQYCKKPYSAYMHRNETPNEATYSHTCF